MWLCFWCRVAVLLWIAEWCVAETVFATFLFMCNVSISVCNDDVLVVAAENIPRTLYSVYRRAERLFYSKSATGRWVKQSLAIVQNAFYSWVPFRMVWIGLILCFFLSEPNAFVFSLVSSVVENESRSYFSMLLQIVNWVLTELNWK